MRVCIISTETDGRSSMVQFEINASPFDLWNDLHMAHNVAGGKVLLLDDLFFVRLVPAKYVTSIIFIGCLPHIPVLITTSGRYFPEKRRRTTSEKLLDTIPDTTKHCSTWGHTSGALTLSLSLFIIPDTILYIGYHPVYGMLSLYVQDIYLPVGFQLRTKSETNTCHRLS